MTIRPSWLTPSGNLGQFDQGQSINILLDSSNTSLIEIISGSLPSGIRLDGESKTISGVAFDIGITKTYDFVLRASNTTGFNNSKIVQDRSFSITISSNPIPTLLDPEGTLKIGLADENYVLNNSRVNYQFTASSTSIPAGQKLIFYVEEGEGELPPGLKLSEDGLLYGTIIDDLDTEFTLVQGTYDKDFYDINPYDYGDSVAPARATSSISLGKINGVTVDYKSYGYLTSPNIVVGGSINSVSVTNAGEGYTSTPEVIFENSPTPGGRTAKGYAVMTLDSSYGISQNTFVDGGNSTSLQNIIIDGLDSSSIDRENLDGEYAIPVTQTTVYYKVSSIVITDPGTGYIDPPKIFFIKQRNGSGATASCTLKVGSGAELFPIITDGTIENIAIINPGSGYTEPPLISFDIPSAGSKIISKIYKFKVSVTNGIGKDSKVYSISVKSEDSLRVDTTFILSDTEEIDTSKTFIQPPIWITGSTLPSIKGDNNFIFDLEIFDPTPTIGKIYFSLMDVNFDGTESQIGPFNTVVNQISYDVIDISVGSPAIIKLSTGDVFNTGDRIKLSNIIGPTELNNGIFYLNKLDSFNYELYSDRILINKISTSLSLPYQGQGKINAYFSYLNLDPEGGEIFGFIPYQPEITRTYTFTVKVSRILDGLEISNNFKQFQLTIKGNIDSDIEFITPMLVGSLNPNEQSLLKIEAVSTLRSASLNYQLVPGYGRNDSISFVELDLTELNGNIFIKDYGINPFITLEKGQVYKINVNLENFSLSFRTSDGSYYNKGIRHSTGAVELSAQEKTNGYYIFNVPYDESNNINLYYTNTQKDGLFLFLEKFNSFNQNWERVIVKNYFSEYDALTDNEKLIPTDKEIFGVFINYKKIELEIKKFNKQTLIWEKQIFPITRPISPSDNDHWLDLSRSNFGILEFQYVGIRGVWVPLKPNITETFPNNNQGSNGDYLIYHNDGVFSALRNINGTWKILERLDFSNKGAFDPNIFFSKSSATAPVTNLTSDIWFKYDTLYDGEDKEIRVLLRSLESLPTDITLGSDGDIIGKISPSTGNTYKGYYTENILYIIGDVVTFDDQLYVCINQNRSSGNWYQDLANWQLFFYSKRTFTSIDVNSFGVGRFSIAGPRGVDETTIDKLLRFRVRVKDTQNVFFRDKDFNIEYQSLNNVTLTNVYLKPFLKKNQRDLFFNFITNPNIFPEKNIYRLEDKEFGVQRFPKMLLLGGIESTIAERYASAVQRNYYDRPLYFGDIKKAIAIKNNKVEYEVIYIEINDPYEIGSNSVRDRIKLDFVYDPLTADYTKIRMDGTDIDVTQFGLDTIYPSSITIMQEELKKVSTQKEENILVVPTYEDWGRIPELQLSGPNQGQYINIDPVTDSEDWGSITERTSLIDDFLLTIVGLISDDNYRPLWMNSTQDNTGNPIGFVKALPICYVKPGNSDKILSEIRKSGFDFKDLDFTIDRIIIQNPLGESGDKYIKFVNREII